MEKFYFEVPSIERKEDAISFINEFYEYHSEINGTGGLQRFLDNYNGWLQKLEEDYNRIPNEEKVPARTYFLIRQNDNRIVGMINIRLALNERLKKFGGNIGYCIRPTERGKGYNKINLYLGLLICHEYGIEKVLMDADKDNPASWKTMEALGGVNIREYYDEENAHCMVKYYEIDVKKSLMEHKDEYESLIFEEKDIPKSVLEYGFDFDWDEEDVWKLNYPEEKINIEVLEWHLDIPFWDWNDERYILTPNQVMKDKEKYKEQYDRIMNSNIDYPIDIMENKGRYVILDGLHRLVKYKIMGYKEIKVRIIPRSEIKNISK